MKEGGAGIVRGGGAGECGKGKVRGSEGQGK